MQPFSSTLQCIPWLVVLIIECLAIIILNIITILVFVKKKRQLQRQSTYLIIHLTIVDLLVGAVCGPLQIKYRNVLSALELQTRDYLVQSFIFCISTFILFYFPYKSYCYFLREVTRNILSIQASLCEEMGL